MGNTGFLSKVNPRDVIILILVIGACFLLYREYTSGTNKDLIKRLKEEESSIIKDRERIAKELDSLKKDYKSMDKDKQKLEQILIQDDSLVKIFINQANQSKSDLTKFKKEFDKMEGALQPAISEFFGLKIATGLKYRKNVLAIKSLILALKNESSSTGWSDTVSNFIIDFISYSMDIYCLARIFKKHKIEGSYQPRESMNVIIYAGFKPTDIYREFFQFVGIQETYEYVNPLKKSCVRTIKEPRVEEEESYLWGVQNEDGLDDLDEVKVETNPDLESFWWLR